ncbi:hypothetical protein [Alteromonas gracilis]|uniref:hypothetical protein n=1 Tax=Alteromonas gracilis TaxID=1479524 RepID=UPI002FE2BD0A
MSKTTRVLSGDGHILTPSMLFCAPWANCTTRHKSNTETILRTIFSLRIVVMPLS